MKKIPLITIPVIAVLTILAWYFYNSHRRVPAFAIGGEKFTSSVSTNLPINSAI